MDVSSDIITLDNFEQRLPTWNAAGANHLYALVDMGSNGIRFSISDLTPPRARLLRCIYRERAAISLFDALSSSSAPLLDRNDPDGTAKSDGHGQQADTDKSSALYFPPETITQVSQSLARFRRIADSYNVPYEHFSVLATEAMRRAANAGAMLAAIRESAGLGVHVLAPHVETLFGAVMGSRSAFVDVSRGGLFLDLGGGSVQMTWVDTRLPAYEIAAANAGESMPFGAARLIRVLEGPHSNEFKTTEKQKLRMSMQTAFAKLCDKFPSLQEACRAYADSDANGDADVLHQHGLDVYMCGGGFRGYGCMLMHNDAIQPYPIASIGTYTATAKSFKQTEKMRMVNAEHQGKIYGMSSRRRQQFPAILEVVEAFVETVPNIKTVTFCAGSNRDGALLMKLPRSMRESSPLDVLAGITEAEMPTVQAVLRTLRQAIPIAVDLDRVPTIFSQGLGPMFARQVWVHQGEDDNANASFALHEAVSRDPSAPGLTHLTRAVLGLSLCARWGSNLGPIDSELYANLKSLVHTADHDALFWAEYLGAVAAIMVNLSPAWPRSEDDIERTVRFESTIDQTKKGKDRISLTVHYSSSESNGIDPEFATERLSGIGKVKGKKEKKVKIQFRNMK